MRNTANQTERARELRQQQTDAERKLWASLANRQLDGVKFRRQQPIGPHIVDFVSFDRRIVIEVDGGHPDEAATRIRDVERTA
jgi:adenine-specific DNA-methyltransferase